jgi:hypothetical protein
MADSSNPASKKNPLDILEDILDNAEANKEEEKAAAEEAKIAEEMRLKDEEARKKDLALLEQERAKMTDIEHSPQAQARISQIAEKNEEAQEKVDQSEGYQIKQLGHTKI